MRGRKPTPTHLKILTGNPGKRRLNRREPTPAGGSSSCPAWLNAAAKAEWRRVVKASPKGLLTRCDRQVLAMYCQNAARIAELEGLIADRGYTLTTDKGYEMQRPEVGILNKVMTLQKGICAELGFSPSSRSRVTVSDPGGQQDPDEAFLFGGKKPA